MSAKNNNNEKLSSSFSTPPQEKIKTAEDKKQPRLRGEETFAVAEIPLPQPKPTLRQELHDIFSEPGIIKIIFDYYLLIQRDTTDFQTDQKDFQTASSITKPDDVDLIQLFVEITTGNKWLGKCSQSALEAKEFLPPHTQYHYAYHDWLGLALYGLLGVTTPERVLSLQLPIKPTTRDHTKYRYDTPCLHTMTKQIVDFVPIGKKFGKVYLDSIDDATPLPLVLTSAGNTLPLKGFGTAMAAAVLFSDPKILGEDYNHLGYVIKKDNDIAYAQVVKVEATSANFYYKGTPSAHQPAAGPPKERKSMPEETYDYLHPADQAEFLQTIYQLLQIPKETFYDLIQQTVCPDGLDEDYADSFFKVIMHSKQYICSKLSHIIYSQLQTDIQKTQHAMILNYFHSAKPPEEKKIKPHATTSPKVSLQSYDNQLATTMKITLQMELVINTPAKDTTCYVFQLPPSNKSLIIQQEPLNSVNQSLHHKRKKGLSWQVISGIGGIGKTQLAMHYAQTAATTNKLGYQAVLWLNAECHLGMQFQAAAKLWLGGVDYPVENAVKAIYKWLSTQRALIVFDHATDPGALKPFLPPSQSYRLIKRLKPQHILITSRNPNWGNIPTVTLTGFNTEEAKRYAQQYLPQTTHAEIVKLDKIANLPLALSHAMAFIAADRCALADYLKYFAKHQYTLDNLWAPLNPGKATLASTFLFPILDLQRQHPCMRLLLETAAYLSPNSILSCFFEKALSQRSNYSIQELAAGIDALVAQSLLTRNKDNTFNMYPLLQELIYHQLSTTAQQARLTANLQLVINAFDDQLQQPDLDCSPILEAFAPHFEILVKYHASSKRPDDIYSATMSIFLSETCPSDVKKCCSLIEQALPTLRAYYGHEHPNLVNSFIKLAVIHTKLGNTAAALSAAQSAYKIMINKSVNHKIPKSMQQHLKTLQTIGISSEQLHNAIGELKPKSTAASAVSFHAPPKSPPTSNTTSATPQDVVPAWMPGSRPQG